MRKSILLFICTFATFFSIAQDIDKMKALELVAANSKQIGMQPEDLQNSIVSSTYFNVYAGTQMVYLQQSYQGLPVYNQLQVLAFKDGKLVSSAGERIKGIGKTGGRLNAAPSISPDQAVMTALSEKKLVSLEKITSLGITNTTKIDFGKLGVAFENITAELMWAPVEATGELALAWQVFLVPVNSSDYLLVRVDAHANRILGISNLTVYCNFGGDTHPNTAKCQNSHRPETIALQTKPSSPSLVGTANYLVIPWPAESPIHPGGAPALRTNPWTMAGGNAASLGWHNDGAIDYLTTRGNNVYAQEDRDNNNSTFGLTAVSTTSPDPLNFNFTPNFTVTPLQTTPVQNQQFNITNLFYWNNITHDLTYLYGFDEASGNFQNDNQGRGGAGSDYVIADAQDAGGTNNANFSTPADGTRPRMQMYLWNGSPQKDGDADNGIIVHEYAHGISNRLTGGPNNTSCLQNGEQMGEGWSDYYALMYTQDWATSNLNTGFNSPRGMGTYVFNQPYTGLGIRDYRYCTNFAVNSIVYAPSISTESHRRGEIWCAVLWDMTWNIINQNGTINPNIFNPAAGGGNAIALRLVTEAMKLQPCSPGFITGRNAILQADQILYGGQYNCAIREAFRRRGMGDNASQGSSGSVTDQVPDFSGGVSILLTQAGMTQVMEAQNIVYTNTVSSTCAAISGFTLRDTLPNNVTYVSGGTYDAVTRVVSFPVTQAAGAVQTYSFTVSVNAGSYFPTITLIDEQVTTSTIPATWTTTATPAANVWTVSSLQSQSPPNSFYVENLAIAGDQKLETTNAVALPAGTSPRLSFAHRFNTEAGWDGGVVEISTNGGSSWTDLGNNMVIGGYNGTLGTAPTNALSNRSAFTGTITSFMNTTVDLSPYAGQSNVKFRFRFGSDDNTSAPSGVAGWYVDNILLSISPVVKMRTSLFNASNTRVSISDTITVIIPGVTCTNASVSSQPANTSACVGSNTTFNVTGAGTNNTYQWQLSIDGGATWSPIPGANSTSYTITGVSAGMNNYRYRVIISNLCPSTVTSNAAILTVSSTANITGQPVDINVCPAANASFSVAASGSNLTYQWQVSTDGGLNYINIGGATSTSLLIPGVNQAMNGNKYRVTVFSCGPSGVNSTAATLTVTAPPTVTNHPVNTAACVGSNAVFTVAGTGAGLGYQWQVSTNGTTFTNLSGETNSTLTLSNISLSQNGYLYRAIVSGSCTSVNSNPAILSINTPVTITGQPGNVAGCSGGIAIFSVSATGTSVSYQWEVSINSGPWVPLSNSTIYAGVTTNTLTISGLNMVMNNYRYRAVVSGVPCGGVTSAPGGLTVNLNPGVVLAAAPYNNLTPSTNSSLYATVSPTGTFTYQWFRDGIILSGINTPAYLVNTDRLGNYQVKVTDANGCTAVSNFVKISDSASNSLFISPNPNAGQFQVRYYNSGAQNVARTIIMYDAKGARVLQRDFNVSGIYQQMDIDARQLGRGIYLVVLKDKNGVQLSASRVLVH